MERLAWTRQPVSSADGARLFQRWNLPLRCDLSLWCSVIFLIAMRRFVQYRLREEGRGVVPTLYRKEDCYAQAPTCPSDAPQRLWVEAWPAHPESSAVPGHRGRGSPAAPGRPAPALSRHL